MISNTPTAKKWTVVMPILNERDRLPDFLPHVKKSCPQAELIFVDGGSTDGSVDWLEEQGVKVLKERPSRGAQIDIGAQQAEGEYLFFLHVDCRCDNSMPEMFSLMEESLLAPKVSAGAFTFQVDSKDPRYRSMEKAVRFRSRILQMPYGDQGLFMKKSMYLSLGGVAKYDLMEDVALHDGLRKRGRIVILDTAIVSSARRFEKRGYMLSNIRNLSLLYLFHLGIPNKILKKIYYYERNRKPVGEALCQDGEKKELHRDNMKVAVIIPALNEEKSLPLVLSALPLDSLEAVIVVDNGSEDQTIEVAKNAGASVVVEQQRGYGAACLRGIEALPDVDVVVFLDADYSDYPEDIELLLEKIAGGDDLVIGSRVLGRAEAGALLPQARFGNALACFLIKYLFGFNYSDLGPFRAIRAPVLARLCMKDRAFGWTIEMQLKAVIVGLKISEVSVGYRQRIGISKITGTLKGTILAGITILSTIFKVFYLHKLRKTNENINFN